MDTSNLTLEDCMCSICLCIYVEPVTMPCTHTLCMPCFKHNVEATSLTCPLCRKRISSWARRAARDKTLVNDALWNKIRSMFPDKVEKRLDGDDEEDDAEINVFQPIISIAQPGEIRREYEEQLKRLEKERELERQREQEASEALIKQLQEEGKMKSITQQLIEERDEELAKELEIVVNEAGSDSPFNLLLNESRNRLSRSRSTSATGSNESRSSYTIDSFLQKMRDAEKLKDADRSSANLGTSPYPYKCFTPSDKDIFSRPSTVTISSRASLHSSTSCTSHNTNVDIATDSPDNLLIQQSDKSCDIRQLEEKGVSKENVSTSVVRSLSAQSVDSINQELNHFKPIRVCPLTPPRRLASGQIVEAQLIRTTPRNLTRMDSFSPTASKSLSDIDAGSPIMQRRWSELEEERKSHVKQNSKSTETTDNSNIKKHDITKYFRKSSEEKDLSPSACSENIPNVNICSENNIPPKKLFIPLEPTFDDNKDFDDVMAPLMEINNIQKVRLESEKPLKARQRMISKQENVNNNSILSPQRTIRDWLSQTNTSPQISLHNCAKIGDTNTQDMEVDSKEGILNLDLNQSACTYNSKLKLKKYPKRKHRAYHISDYVYPQLSPKKKKIDYIEISSDEEAKNCESEKRLRSKTCQNRTKNTCKTDIYKNTGIKKLKSVKHTKHLNKQHGVKTMQSVLPTTHSYIKKTNHSDVGRVLHDDVFKDLSNVLTDKLKQEEADRQLALKLEKIFQYEKTGHKFSAIRTKGSDNEYNFRRKSKCSSK